MNQHHQLITADAALASPLRRSGASTGRVLRVGAVQQAWNPDPERHLVELASGIRLAAAEGAQLICLQELTLSPYFATTDDQGADAAEPLTGGPTFRFASALARETGSFIHASLFERADDTDSAVPGYNTAICVAPDGELAAWTRKIHIPRFDGYHEDAYFRPGNTGYPVHQLAGAQVALPTCWDQWFPELSRSYGLAGAEVIVYPTAIGSEPDVPGFDTRPIWQQVITANGITAATFMIAVNRIGTEDPLSFYGSSFISDPYGRVIVQAPRDRAAVLVADLDLAQREDWLTFGLHATRRPETYGQLLAG
jgi:N-carbamoylputrescine amidase